MTRTQADEALLEGDGDVFHQDVAFSLFKDKLTAERDALVRIARFGWSVAVAFVGLTVFLVVKHIDDSNAWKKFRFPFVWANAQGTPMLVTNAQSGEAYNDIPDLVVNGQIRSFLDQRFGASAYHARQLWGPFMAYWLTPNQAKAFKAEASATLDALQKEGMWRRVQVRVIQIDKRTPLEGGGTRYDATVEFVSSDLKIEDSTPKRTYWWRMRTAISLGTPFGLTDPKEIQAAGAANMLNFRLIEEYKPIPIEIPGDDSPRLGTIQTSTDLLSTRPAPAPAPANLSGAPAPVAR